MKRKTPHALSIGEETFAMHCKAVLTPLYQPDREFQFCERGWRFDFAWPWLKIAVEVEGGTSFGKSRHSRGAGFEQDAAKYNRAAIDGWRVLRYSTRMVCDGLAIDEVKRLLGSIA